MKKDNPYLVCFGDSLTAGYQAGAGGLSLNVETPPGGFIQEWVGSQAQVVVAAICGETTAEMVQRFSQSVSARSPKFVVILGGTNDLGLGVNPLHISENLSWMYLHAREVGIEPVGVTVPSIYLRREGGQSIPDWAQNHITQRLVLNREIANVCKKLDMKCLDLFRETGDSGGKLLSARFSSDGLHFNTAGYEVFARLIWKRVLADTFGQGLSII
jgi:lysophospholipase L1-like esterase